MTGHTILDTRAADLALTLTEDLGAPIIHDDGDGAIVLVWEIPGARNAGLHVDLSYGEIRATIMQDELRTPVRVLRSSRNMGGAAAACRMAIRRWLAARA